MILPMKITMSCHSPTFTFSSVMPVVCNDPERAVERAAVTDASVVTAFSPALSVSFFGPILRSP